MDHFRKLNGTKTIYREEDYPFIEACFSMMLDINIKHGRPYMFSSTFEPILNLNGECEEVLLYWGNGLSKLRVALGKQTTIVHELERQRGSDRIPVTVEEIKTQLAQIPGVDSEIASRLIQYVDYLSNSGYCLTVVNGRYPVPVILMNKTDSLIGAVSFLEVSKNPSKSQNKTIQ